MSEKKHELIIVFAALIISCFFLIYEVFDSPKYGKSEAVEIITSSFFPEETKPDQTGKVNINTASLEELCTLEEVGEKFQITRERIRQIEAKALRKLRHPSRSKKLRAYLD